MTDSAPFLTDGISLGIPNTSATTVEQIDNAVFLDSNGYLNFKDNYTANLLDINGNPVNTLTLQDLYTRINGVYVAGDGQLYFKDSTTSRAYSLKELVGAYIDWQQKLTTGGIFWVGSTRITSIQCNNLIVNTLGDPNLPANAPAISGQARIYEELESGQYPSYAVGTKVFSIDEYLNGVTGDFRLNTDGSWRWYDVPNLQILIPPVDVNKIGVIIAKISVRLIKANSPVVFRLVDTTTGLELDRKALANDTDFAVEQQPILTFVGPIVPFQQQLQQLACQCPTQNQQVALAQEPAHTLSIQFHVDDMYLDTPDFQVYDMKCQNVSGDLFVDVDDTSNIRYNAFERRIIGLPNSITTDPIVNSSIDVILYDTTPSDSSGRKAATIAFSNQDLINVVFDVPFTSSVYSITLSTDKNINSWYTNKTSTGFTIRTERKFTGNVDWIATKLSSQGEA